MKFKNETTQSQQIMLANGSGLTVLPGKSVKVDEKSIFPYELERVKKIFIEVLMPIKKEKVIEKPMVEEPEIKKKKGDN